MCENDETDGSIALGDRSLKRMIKERERRVAVESAER